MKMSLHLAFSYFIFSGLAVVSEAIDARPLPFTETRPNGEKIVLMLQGDEYEHILTDLNGYAVEKNEYGEYVYVDQMDYGLSYRANYLVGTTDPIADDLSRVAKPPKDCFKQICGGTPHDTDEESVMHGSERRLGQTVAKTTGAMNNLVVLLYFKDHASSTRKLPSEADIDILMNADEPDPEICPTGSLKRVYRDMSYGQLEIQSTVTPWFVTSKPEAWYADGRSGTTNLHEALREALDYLDENDIVNFADFDEDGDGMIDSITFLHSGYGAEWGQSDCYGQDRSDRIWSHKWSIWGDSNGRNVGPWVSKDRKVTVRKYHISPALWGTCNSDIGRIGVIAHETGHFLGIPDLYDTDRGGRGLGGFCLMGSSWGFDNQQLYPGIHSAWTRMKLGWTVPAIPTAGANEIALAEEPSRGIPQVYIIGEEFGFPKGEYLLIENRQLVGLDSILPKPGLAIYHIDEKAGFVTEGYPGQKNWPQNGNHYRVALLQADGFYNLERGDNKGGSRDFFHADDIDQLKPSDDPLKGPFPNTDSYQFGKVYQTGVQIYNISVSGDIMSFQFSHPNAQVVEAPSIPPSISPSSEPTQPSEVYPSRSPSVGPSQSPTVSPSLFPSTLPTLSPSRAISSSPTVSEAPSTSTPPSDLPSYYASKEPNLAPSESPSFVPSLSNQPSAIPSPRPSHLPSLLPTRTPTFVSSDFPSSLPTWTPSSLPTSWPTRPPTLAPSDAPSEWVCREKNEECNVDEDCCKNKCKNSRCKK